jgi:hypothetical protein
MDIAPQRQMSYGFWWSLNTSVASFFSSLAPCATLPRPVVPTPSHASGLGFGI